VFRNRCKIKKVQN